ncbi:MAG: DUF4282 domain-containing protein [Hyphomonadaceae bacterium]
MQSILQRFIGFDRLLGPVLAKFVYYFGAVVILALTAFGVLMALMALAAGNFSTGLMQLLATPAVGAVAFVYWRFVCELFLLAFLAYERMGEIRDTLRAATGAASAPDPNHPTF